MKKTFITIVLIVYANANMIITSKDDYWIQINLVGKNEKCFISVRVEDFGKGRVLGSGCLFLTNSKKIDIICTKNKTICKTINEVKKLADNQQIKINKIEKKNNHSIYYTRAYIKEQCTVYAQSICYEKKLERHRVNEIYNKCVSLTKSTGNMKISKELLINSL